VTNWVPLVAIVAFVPAQLLSQAQVRPDFSGKWSLATKSVRGPGNPDSRSCARVLVLNQDQAALHVQLGDDAGRARAYRFDGTDRVEPLAPAPARLVGASPNRWDGHLTRYVARAGWNGDKFVIVTHSTMTMTWPSQMPGAFDRETTSKAVYAFNEAGQLVIDYPELADPLPGGPPVHFEMPDSWTCIYAKTVQAQ